MYFWCGFVEGKFFFGVGFVVFVGGLDGLDDILFNDVWGYVSVGLLGMGVVWLMNEWIYVKVRII